LGLLVIIKAHALVPEPPNPLSTANLSFDQRLDQIQQTDAALLQATPAERKAYWKKLQVQRKAMSPEERKLVHDKMQASWKSMTPEQKEAIKAERKAFFDKLTPDEQATMRAHKAKWEHMNPEEKKNWNTKAS
jgi:hypothetical protein